MSDTQKLLPCPQRCATCGLARRMGNGILACMSKTSPARGWYPTDDFGCDEWRAALSHGEDDNGK